MIITYLRSSSYNGWDFCNHQYFLSYVLGLPDPAGKAAAKGNVVHKALELLTRKKICQQKNLDSYDDDTFGLIRADEITPEWSVEKAYHYYKEVEPHHDWKPRDFKDCQQWTEKARAFRDGAFDPLKLDIIDAEQRFDITIPHKWARYRYETPDGILEGQLSLKGTMDLVVRDKHNPNVIEAIDWKTGKRKDWATGEEKTYKKLRYDPQLCLYHYALSHLYPDAEEIVMTIYYINYGGPFRLFFEKRDLEYTESIIRKRFEEIRNTQRPRLKKTWKCKTLCTYGKTAYPGDEQGRTYCEFFEDQVRKKGADQVFVEFGDVKRATSYGSGGGRQSAAES